MAKLVTRNCPQCNETKAFRSDCKTCGCPKPSLVVDVREESTNGLSINLPKTRIHTLEQLIERCEVDTAVWEVESFRASKWEMGARTDEGAITVEPLYAVSAKFKRKVAVLAVRAEIESLREDAKSAAKILPARKYTETDDNMLEISIPDLHFGKLAWATETGYENYDLPLARECYQKALGTLLARSSHQSYKQIVFVVGNDLLHSDNPQGTTTKGTHVSCDGRFQKTFKTVRQLVAESIEHLVTLAPVKVIMVPGNHDTQAVWHLGDSLECYFDKAKHIEIDNQPRQRKYHQFQRVMLMFTHGDKGKRTDYPLVMATEQPKMFGETFWRECHTGHTHHEQTNEFHGVRVRTLPALCAADDWHSENFYVGNIRSAEVFVWNGQEGLIGTASYALPVDSSNRVRGHQK